AIHLRVGPRFDPAFAWHSAWRGLFTGTSSDPRRSRAGLFGRAGSIDVPGAEGADRRGAGVVGVAPDAAGVVRQEVDRHGGHGGGGAHAVDVVRGRQERVAVAAADGPA